MTAADRQDGIMARYRALEDSARWFAREGDECARAQVERERERLWGLLASREFSEVFEAADARDQQVWRTQGGDHPDGLFAR